MPCSPASLSCPTIDREITCASSGQPNNSETCSEAADGVTRESEDRSWLSLLRPLRQDQLRRYSGACLCPVPLQQGSTRIRAFADIEAHGGEQWLAELALALREEIYRPWLDCPVEETDKRGSETHTTEARDNRRGIPQGSPLSPLLANLYMRLVLGWKRLALSDVSALASSPKTLGYPYFEPMLRCIINLTEFKNYVSDNSVIEIQRKRAAAFAQHRVSTIFSDLMLELNNPK